MRFLPAAPARVCLAAVLFTLAASAQQTLTVDKLLEFIKSSITQKNKDADVAKILSGMKMSERLSPTVVEQLQMSGAGPKTVDVLRSMVTQTANLTPPPAKMVMGTSRGPAGGPPPSSADQRKVLEDTREIALGYVKSLPDFVCAQSTWRYVDQHFQVGTEGSWAFEDRIIEKLSFFDHKENYEPISHNDTAMFGKTWEKLGGSFSRGEWATLLSEVFEPTSNTHFNWTRWGNVRGHLTHVYEYRVEQQYSQETISYQNEQKIVAGFHGEVFIEKATNMVLRITVTPEIPPSFPVQDVQQTVDYDYQAIGPQTFLLPFKSQVQMRDGHFASKNEIEWRSYRKYSADTSITFDTGDDKPTPDDKPKEPAPK